MENKLLFVFMMILICFNSFVICEEIYGESLWHFYTDENVGGKSECYGVVSADSSTQWIFKLKKNDSHIWPYVGITRYINEKKIRKNSRSDTLVAVVKSSRNMVIMFRLSIFDRVVSKAGRPETLRVFEYPVNVDREKRRITVPIRQFRVADWWRKKYNVSINDNETYPDSICKIDFAVNDPLYAGITDTLNIYSVYMKRGGTEHIWFIMSILSVFLMLMLIIIIKREKIKGNSGKNSLKIKPVKLEADMTDWERILDYLSKNYSDTEICLKKTAKETGFSESKVSHIISSKYNDGFRGLLHDLRISEAKRLLLESEMNVSEVAYKLGYATPNHFNREFRKRTQLSPTLFRKHSSIS